ncbi:MAG TPA: glycoside hydrolase family 9 protein [Sphingobacteriaceae bacterium]
MKPSGLILSIFMLGMIVSTLNAQEKSDSWIRINQLGYAPTGLKVAVLGSKKQEQPVKYFELINTKTSKTVLRKKIGKSFGKYGPFTTSYRLDFSKFKIPGSYYLQAGKVRSPEFKISTDIYKGTADFALRYMRQQRSGYNPFLKDSCHTTDGYIVYGPVPERTHIDAAGGWHDASDYLQYSTTSANATYHLLAAYRDFPAVFTDKHRANGLDGTNGTADVLDEARWGLDWLLKMHPREDWLFNQIADDRDHMGLRLPNNDTVDYGFGKGKGRPVYFITGEPQGLGKYKNQATGAASTAGKFASAFALAAQIYSEDTKLSETFKSKSLSAYNLGLAKPGVAQTASVKSPYIYAEDNWVDDMELGAAAIFQLTENKSFFNQALAYSEQEKITPWLGADTARHYQWYPFHNFGHYELAKKSDDAKSKAQLIRYYKQGIEKVWQKSKNNAFYRGIPFIWCSNNLTTSFAIQCYLYRQLSGDKTYLELEQACIDWLFGCNPWGTSMVYGLPANGDSPVDPHSAFTVLKNYPLDGGLVDGPVYGNIYKNLIGIRLHEPDEYAEFQSDFVVYHDDYGDYSTNEPTMDGTASLIYLLAAKEHDSREGVARKK